MKKEDIKTLLDLGFNLDSIKDIDFNKKYCKYILERKSPYGEIRISATQARSLLGDRPYLSGLAKSCLGEWNRWYTTKEVSGQTIGRYRVTFDCSDAVVLRPKRRTKKTLDIKVVEDLIMLNNLYKEYSDLDKEFSAECKENPKSPYIEELAREVDRIGLEIKKIEDRYADAA